jgi:hypothetical protein
VSAPFNCSAAVHGKGLQLGLNFADITSELFAGLEKGADSLRVLKDYRKLHERITADVKAELPQVDIPAAQSTSRKKPVTTDRTSTLNLYCPPNGVQFIAKAKYRTDFTPTCKFGDFLCNKAK